MLDCFLNLSSLKKHTNARRPVALSMKFFLSTCVRVGNSRDVSSSSPLNSELIPILVRVFTVSSEYILCERSSLQRTYVHTFWQIYSPKKR